MEMNALLAALIGTDQENSTCLSFAEKQMKIIEEKDADYVVKEIDKMEKLEVLEMRNNTIGIGGAQAIGNALSKQPHLKEALWSDSFTGRLKEEIPIALKHLFDGVISAGAPLRVLDLSNNAFGPNVAPSIQHFFSSDVAFHLQVLNLNNCGLGIQGGMMIASSLLKCRERSVLAGKPMRLKVFVAGRNRLEVSGAVAFAQVFKSMGSLEEVEMPQNGIYPKGFEALADSLSSNHQLRKLNLSDNTAKERGAVCLAYAFRHLKAIQILNLEDCLLKASGAHVIAESLADGHSSLAELYLSGNEVDFETGSAISELFLDHPSLKKLGLSSNNFGWNFEELREKTKHLPYDVDLGNLSDDQGSVDEEDGEDSDTDSIDEEEEELEVGVSPLRRPDPASINGMCLPSQPPVVEEGRIFVEQPTWPGLRGMGLSAPDRIWDQVLAPKFAQIPRTVSRQDVASIKTHLEREPEVMEKVAHVLIQVASVVTRVNEKETLATVLGCCGELVEKALLEARQLKFLSAPPDSSLLNFLLEKAGLVKTEGENSKSDYVPAENLYGVLTVLERLLSRPPFGDEKRKTLAFHSLRRKEELRKNGDLEDVIRKMEAL